MLAALVAAALVSFVLVRAQQSSGTSIVAQQRSGDRLTPAAVARVIRANDEPDTHIAAEGARCRPGSQGVLQNNWSCRLRYPHGLTVSWTVKLLTNGGYVGVNQVVRRPGRAPQSFGGIITGCCVSVP